MKNNSQKAKNKIKNLVNKYFMESPFPMVITKAKDGTYIEANKTAMRFWGWPRKQIIGHQSTELGVISPEQRNKFTHEIKKQGFAKDIPFEARIKNKGILHISFNIFPIKMGKETFFLSIGTDAFNYQTILKKHRHEKFFKLTEVVWVLRTENRDL